MEYTTSTIGSLVEDVVAHRLQSFGTLHVPTMALSHVYLVEKTLAADIHDLRSILARFTRQLNYIRSPILRLPPEILQLIITTVVRSVQNETAYVKQDPRRWILLGRVSHRFRVMLLAIHTLWGNTVSSPHLPTARQILLERAQGAPIELDIGVRSASQETDNFSFCHLEQARTIQASDIYRITVRPLLDKLVTGTFQHLKSLNLLAHQPTDLQVGGSAVQVMGLDKTSFAYHQSAICAPKLRLLSLQNVFIPFEASTLTSLSLHRLHDTRSAELLPPEHFLGMLRRCINVQELTLSYYLPIITSPSAIPPDRIHLPALRALSLWDTRNRILSFWPIIQVPASTILEVDLWTPPASSESLSSHIEGSSVFVPHVLAPQFMPFTRLEIQGSDPDGGLSFELMIPQVGPSNRFAKYPDHPQKETFAHISVLKLTAYSDAWDALDIKRSVQLFASMYQLSHIQCLETSQDVLDMLGDAPQTILASFPSLQTLTVHEIDETFFGTLVEGQVVPPSHPFGVLSHPKVHSLALWGTSYSLTLKHVNKLAALLRSRLENHIPIHTLELSFPPDWRFTPAENEAVQTLYHRMLVNLVVPGPLVLQID